MIPINFIKNVVFCLFFLICLFCVVTAVDVTKNYFKIEKPYEYDCLNEKSVNFSTNALKEMKKSNFYLVNDFQGGIYFVNAKIDLLEPGFLYLKVFESKNGTPLSAESIKKSSIKKVFLPKNEHQLFFYKAKITIYEGDWGRYYPARFEIWFVPDSKTPEKKLIEKVFEVEGWQR